MKDKYKVIIVEDEAPIRRSLHNKISTCGLPYNIIGAFKNGKQALDFVKTNKPNVIFTDIKMPIMNGLELANEIHTNFPEIFMVIISGFNDFEYAREALKYQVTDYLTKPVDIDELTNILNELEIKLDRENPDLNKNAQEMLDQRNGSDLIDNIVEYLSFNKSSNITIKDVATQFNYTQEYITRFFKKQKNVTLQHYIIELKICEAKKILRNYEQLDIQSIGELVGYSDPYYFSRIFKKYTGATPSLYRKHYKKIQ